MMLRLQIQPYRRGTQGAELYRDIMLKYLYCPPSHYFLEKKHYTLITELSQTQVSNIFRLTVSSSGASFCRSEGVLSSFYSLFTSSEPAVNKGPTLEEQEASKQAQTCIRDCHLEQLILDSKFLREDSLQELVKVWN